MDKIVLFRQKDESNIFVEVMLYLSSIDKLKALTPFLKPRKNRYESICPVYDLEDQTSGRKLRSICASPEPGKSIDSSFSKECVWNENIVRLNKREWGYNNKTHKLTDLVFFIENAYHQKYTIELEGDTYAFIENISEFTIPQNVKNNITANMDYSKYISLLKANYNLVLTGAPGTGKTFMAKEIAKEMNAETMFVQFHPSYDYTDFVEGLRPVDNDGQMGFERKDGVFKEFCKKAIKNIEDSSKSVAELTQEHTLEDSYSLLIDSINDSDDVYEFTLKSGDKKMEVVKISNNNNIILKTKDTDSQRTYTVSFDRLLKLSKVYPDTQSLNQISNISTGIRGIIGGCNASSYWAVLHKLYEIDNNDVDTSCSAVERKLFVCIIDEINRGEASKIFGELFYAIDPGYRGKTEIKVKTQYQNLVEDDDIFADGFYVPDNVYILATMNDIDRSVESMDFAMRRRFTWQEVTPSDTQDMLNTLGGQLATQAKAAMSRLNKKIENTEELGSAYMIGPSYFLKLKNDGYNLDVLWNLNIEPLLKEYLRGVRKAQDIIKGYKKTYFNDEQTESSSENVDENVVTNAD